MCNYISPVLESIDISEITHDMMRSRIERSGAPAKAMTTLRAVMRRAFDDGWDDGGALPPACHRTQGQAGTR